MISNHVRTALLLAAAAASVVATTPVPAAAQSLDGPGGSDVELLGRQYGTRPPAAYYEMKARDPDAFTFSRAWKNRNPHLQRVRDGGPGERPRFEVVGTGTGGGSGGDFDRLAALGPREGGVTGTILFPLVLGLYADSPDTPPFTRDRVQGEFFDGPNSYYKTITEFYDELSGGRLDLKGETTDWRRSDRTAEEVAGGSSGLSGSSEVGAFIFDLLSEIERTGNVDWGRYDNDGPDGVPNSGDDDGYVDVLAVMHPTMGAECVGDFGSDELVWSHKWDLESAAGQAYVTDTDRTGGSDKIRISDYTIQPVYACPPGGEPTEINEIGVLAHELGHGLGLPDLYDTNLSDGRHAGIGRWGLMGSGSWGCSGSSGPERPCHMSAWSKEQLGWVDVVGLGADADLGTVAFRPVESSGEVYRFDAGDGSGDYFLLENRQRIGFDESLVREGLLVWHVDPEVVESRWATNRVNADGTHLGVFLRQADDQNHLALEGSDGNAGDAGDPFPGAAGNTVFHAGSAPASWTWDGSMSGLTLTDITPSGDDVTAAVLTRFQQVTLQTDGDDGGTAGFAVDGTAVPQFESFTAAPHQTVEIAADGGAEVSDGVRVGFTGWADDDSVGRVRTFVAPPEDVTLTATYGGTEFRARVSVTGSRFDVPAGEVALEPQAEDEGGDFWFSQGTDVTFEAVANTGYAFDGWSGALAGAGSPVTVTLDEPVEATALFELVYAVTSETHTFEAARQQEIQLVAENGTSPVEWSRVDGSLPRGMSLNADGTIRGTAFESGTFPVTLRARDANGLEATGELVLEAQDPVLGLDALTAPFLGTSGSLTSLEVAFLDVNGNDNGVYDLGDFRVWVLDHPDLPSTVEERALVRSLIPLIRFEPGGGR